MKKIQAACKILHETSKRARTDDEVALIGLAVGAAYALTRARELKYQDRTGTRQPPNYPIEIEGAAGDLVDGKAIKQSAWLAGFYFNSALQRMASLNELLSNYAGKPEVAESVRKEVNRMKHDLGALLKRGRSVSFDEATGCLLDLSNATRGVMGSTHGTA